MVEMVKNNQNVEESLDKYCLNMDSNIARELLDKFGCRNEAKLTFIPLQEGMNEFSIKDFYPEEDEKLNRFSNKNFMYVSWSIKKSDYKLIYNNNIMCDRFKKESTDTLKKMVSSAKYINGFFITDIFNKFIYFVGFMFFTDNNNESFIYSVPTFYFEEETTLESTVKQFKEDLQYQDSIDNKLTIIDAKEIDKNSELYKNRCDIYGGEKEFQSILGIYNSMLVINWPILSVEKDHVFTTEEIARFEKLFNNETLNFDSILKKYNLNKEDFIIKDEAGNYRSTNDFKVTGICDKVPVTGIYYMFGLKVQLNDNVFHASVPMMIRGF